MGNIPIPIFLLLSVSCLLIYKWIGRYLSTRLPLHLEHTLTVRPMSIGSWEKASLFAVLCTSLLIELPHMDRGLSYDEIFTTMYFIEVDSLWTTISTYHVFNNHIAYSILAFFSQAWLGDNEWVLRLPALLLGLGGIGWLWLLARRLFNPNVAILAALSLSISPNYVVYSLSARGYSGMVFLTLISSDFYLRILESRGRSKQWFGIIYTIASVVAIYFHLYAALLVIAQALILFLRAMNQVRKWLPGNPLQRESFQVLWLAFPAIGISSVLLYAPVLDALLFWIGRRGQGAFRWNFPLEVIGELSGGVDSFLVLLIFLVTLVGICSLLKSQSQLIQYSLFLLIVPFGLVWVSRPLDLYPRFFSYFLPYYLIYFVEGLLFIWRAIRRQCRVVYRVILSGLFIFTAASVFGVWASDAILLKRAPEEGFRELVQAMEAGADPIAQLCVIGMLADVYDYYAERPVVRYTAFDEFLEQTKDMSQFRCAFWRTRSVSVAEQRIVAWLAQNATVQYLGRFEIYTVRK